MITLTLSNSSQILVAIQSEQFFVLCVLWWRSIRVMDNQYSMLNCFYLNLFYSYMLEYVTYLGASTIKLLVEMVLWHGSRANVTKITNSNLNHSSFKGNIYRMYEVGLCYIHTFSSKGSRVRRRIRV